MSKLSGYAAEKRLLQQGQLWEKLFVVLASAMWLAIIPAIVLVGTSTTAHAVMIAPEDDLSGAENNGHTLGSDRAPFQDQMFSPVVTGDGTATSNGVFAEVRTSNETVEMCVLDKETGREISGTLPGGTPINNWAGVLSVTINGISQKAFCTDINNEIRRGCNSNSTFGATDPLVACTLQYFPPVAGLSSDEAAARQATIWYFSDDFSMTSPSGVKSIHEEQVAFILAQYEAGLCGALPTPSLTIDPSSAVNFLVPDGSGGYLPSPHEYTVRLSRGAQPMPNVPVSVTTDLGTLTSGTSSGTTIQVTTDTNGEAKVTISHNAPGTAMIVANTVVTLPSGTRIDPSPTAQKIVVAGIDEFPLQASATKQWEAGGNIVIQKFHDRDRNGVYTNPPDELMDWQVRYRQQDGSDFSGDGWTELALGPDGSATIGVELGKNYQVCEITQAGWTPTTPVCYAGVTAGNTVAFGNVELPALLIVKYHDQNGNGIRDPGEPGLGGWQFDVQRFDNGVWSASYSGQTDNSGNLAFSNVLSPFEYRVIETMQSDWFSSTATLQTVLIDDSELYTVTFGNLQPASLILEKEWFSSDVQVEGDEPATICLQRNPAPPTHAPAPTVNGVPLTLTEGAYCTSVVDTVTVEQIWPGNYTISERPMAGWNVDIDSHERLLVSGGSDRITFRNDQILSGLGDYVWEDLNRNGIQDDGEPGVANVMVTLFNSNDEQVGTPITTDINGFYVFTNLIPGTYYVVFNPATLPTGYTFTTPDQPGASEEKDSDADSTGKTQSVTLAPGDLYLHLDAGIVEEAAIPLLGRLGDTVWFDEDKDGIQDSNEEGVPGVLVELYTMDGTLVATDTTDANGKYLFDELAAETYIVQFATVPGYSFTRHNVNSNSQDALDSDPLVPYLEVSVSDGGVEGEFGKPLTYTLFYTNADADLTAQDVVFSTTVPEGTSFTPEGSSSGFTPEGSNSGWVCDDTNAGGVCSLTLPSVAAGEQGSIFFVVTLADTDEEVPDVLTLLVSLTQGTAARTVAVPLGEGETNLTVDAGIVQITAAAQTATPTDTTSLPEGDQPAQQRLLFLPAVESGQ